ncbi:glycoside hydrolase family 25 protein [Roseateles aquatilis]|uniref:glycoside hydrolase family 25 protein n=1 Tax=Roseateles aquatilis TaxID=431061 RepID=UPI001303A199|nr:glycoside hydrolase family 25 protein [Roseateles aquatilis]
MDLSHLHTDLDLPVARDAGLVGLLHKATQGATFTDPAWSDRARQARDLGLLLGAYHFCTNEPVEAQLDHFLGVLRVTGCEGVLPCLDWEPNPIAAQGTMTQASLVALIDRFHDSTGLYPVLYGGYWMLQALSTRQPLGHIGQCPLWQGFYSSAFGWLSDIWERWTLLQYTDGHFGPRPRDFPGLGAVDRDTFNGTLPEAQAFWRTHALRG